MEAYTGFANVYDEFMDNVPYDEWTEYLTGLLKEYGVDENKLVLELGCGTGSMTRRLAKRGYDMIGVDYSDDMLEIAREKGMEEGFSFDQILYLNQDMREFELYGTVAAVVSICDSMNYITNPDDLRQVFKLVNNYLDPRGVFIFDMNTVHKYRDILGETTIAENREDASFIWENYYDKEQRVNQYDITIYKKVDLELEDEDEESPTALFERFEETHYQKAYELEEVIKLLEEAGMEYVTSYDVGTKNPPNENSERIYIVAREKKQENKFYIDER
ncbi:MAG: class I SAM-dependent methyltransferase [Clostridiales bacterium]|nr:class I SAM-dependent methyltransferase [Clostridiales bacterium]